MSVSQSASMASGSPSNSVEVLEVVVIGAGFSGICASIKLLEKGITNFKVYDKAPKIGGAWYYNTYPGVACDIASHLYCYSFEPNPNWSRIYSPGSEIRDYIEHCAVKYRVTPHIQHNMECTGARFNDRTQLWDVSFADGTVVSAYFVISGSGGLHTPSFPDIPGRNNFSGASMHSACWNHDVDLNGKRVAVIGSAASAIQLIPEVAKVAKQVDVYQRTPNYILRRGDREYTDSEKERFKKWPLLNKIHRAKWFYLGELFSYPLVKTKDDTRYSQRARKAINRYMRLMVKDKDLHGSLTPDYQVGCKRILLSDNFFPSLNRDNVNVVTDGIKTIEDDGIVTNNDELHKADVIVYATGFDIEKHMLSVTLVGPNNRDIKDTWSDLPEAYEGAMIAGFPNLFLLAGPNTGVGTTSVVYIVEKQVNYILSCIEKSGKNRLIAPKADAMKKYNSEIQNKLSETVWAGSCQSWYRREDGKIVTLYPYNARTFRDRHKQVKWEDFVIESRASHQKEDVCS